MFSISSSTRFFIALSLITLLTVSAFTQQKAPPKSGGMGEQKGGVTTGEARVYTSRRTVGITDAKAPVVYEDVTAQTALINFKHKAGNPQKDYILDSPPSGVAIFDYDGDGKPDIYPTTGLIWDSTCPNHRTEYFIEGTAPELTCSSKPVQPGDEPLKPEQQTDGDKQEEKDKSEEPTDPLEKMKKIMKEKREERQTVKDAVQEHRDDHRQPNRQPDKRP